MVIGGKRHECIAAPALPHLMGSRLVPMPCCFRRATTGSPWFAIDPVLRADCMAFCRRARLALVAVFAVFGLCRMADAAEPAANNTQTGIASLLVRNGQVEATAAIACANQRALKLAIYPGTFGSKAPLTFETLFNLPGPRAPKIKIERAHAPPAADVPAALFRIFNYSARRSLAKSSDIVPLSRLPLPVSILSFTTLARLIAPQDLFGGSAMLRGSARTTMLVSLIRTSTLGEIAYVCC